MNHNNLVFVYEYDGTNLPQVNIPFEINLDTPDPDLLGFIIKVVAKNTGNKLTGETNIEYALEYTELTLPNLPPNAPPYTFQPMGGQFKVGVTDDQYGIMVPMPQTSLPFPIGNQLLSAFELVNDYRFEFQPRTSAAFSNTGKIGYKTIDLCFLSAADFIYLMNTIKVLGKGTLIISGAKIIPGNVLDNSRLENPNSGDGYFTLKFETLGEINLDIITFFNTIDPNVEPDVLFADPCPPLWSVSTTGGGKILKDEEIRSFKLLKKSVHKLISKVSEHEARGPQT